jgi:hypothetical protein
MALQIDVDCLCYIYKSQVEFWFETLCDAHLILKVVGIDRLF